MANVGRRPTYDRTTVVVRPECIGIDRLGADSDDGCWNEARRAYIGEKTCLRRELGRGDNQDKE